MMQSDRRRGFALLAALWLVVAITTVALEFGLQAHEQRRTTIDLDMRTQALEAALAGVATEQAHLAYITSHVASILSGGVTVPGANPDPNRVLTSIVYGLFPLPDTERVDNGTFIASMSFDALLNVNQMSEEMWRRFLLAFGIGYDTADRLAQAIMDWRDPDDFPRPRGAERDSYLRAGASVLPTNKNFANVQELRDVLGMTPDIYAMIAPYLSVCTSGGIDVNAAPGPVLHAIPGFNDEVVATILAQRTAQPFNNRGEIENRVSNPARQGLEMYADSIDAILNRGIQTEHIIVSTGWAPDHRTHMTIQAKTDAYAMDVLRCGE